MSDVTRPLSILSKTSFSTSKIADSVAWNFLYSDCKLLDIEFASMCESRRDVTTFSNIFDIKLRFETGRHFLVHLYLALFFSRGLCFF